MLLIWKQSAERGGNELSAVALGGGRVTDANGMEASRKHIAQEIHMGSRNGPDFLTQE